MADDETPDDLRARLRDVETQLRELRGESAGITDQVGGQGNGAGDSEDTAAAVTNLEENEALIAALQARRESLQRRVEDAG